MEVSGDVGIASFSMESVVRGHHVYKTIWTSAVGEELQCHREVGNIHDLYAVSVIKPGTGVVGHIPRRISTPCNMFIRSGGSITCIVTGSRHYSVDLPQGGLEVPCRLQFKGNEKAINTIKPLLQNAPPEASSQVIHEATNQDSEQAKTGDAHKFTTGATAFRQNLKSVTSEPITLPDLVNESSSSEDNVWVQVRKSKLSLSDKESLLTLERPLIVFAQVLFKEQYPNVSGFMSTLLQYKPLTAKLTSGVQIIHCRDFHWVTAYKKNSSKDVTVYDSMFDSPDDTLTKVITNIFDTSKLIMAPMQRQSPGSNNCGIFAIAVCMAILLEEDPSEIRLNEDVMRCHLCKCFDKKIMMKFP